MKNQIIHVGYPKTGTTWFQEEFYPKVRNFKFLQPSFVKEAIIKPSPADFNANMLQKKIIERFGEKLILCEELLIGSISSGGFNLMHTILMAQRLKALFPDAEIVLFIRNQADIIVSEYGQYIKDGGRKKITDFLFPEHKNLMMVLRSFSLEFLEYNKAIKFYRSLFGHHVQVYLYEEFAENTRDFIKNFSSENTIDLDSDSLSVEKKNIGPANVHLIRQLNRIPVFGNNLSLQLMNRMKYQDKPVRNKFTSKMVLGKFYNQLTEYYKESNNLLNAMIGSGSLEKYGYPL